MPTTLITLIQYGTPVILLGLIISNVYLAQAVRVLQKSVDNVKEGVTWDDKCEALHGEINRRLKRLETQFNGK